MSESKRFLLLYGSQTGKAESIAQIIAEKSEQHGLEAELRLLHYMAKEFDQLTEEKCVVIVSSTTGDGEQPENAARFYRKLRMRKLEKNHFSNVNFTVLGLGDTNYSQFCHAPKCIHERMLQLGAKEFYPADWADDGIGLEEVVEPWIEGLWPALKRFFGIDNDNVNNETNNVNENVNKSEDKVDKEYTMESQLVSGLSDLTLNEPKDLKSVITEEMCATVDESVIPKASNPSIKLNFSDKMNEKTSVIDEDFVAPAFPTSSSAIYSVPIVKLRKLTFHEDAKRAFLLTLNIKETPIKCEPGDALGLVCPNNDVEVDELLSLLGLDDKADAVYELKMSEEAPKSKKAPAHLPKKGTLRHAFKHYVDFRAMPSKPLLRILADSTFNEVDRRRLLFLCGPVRSQGASIRRILDRNLRCGLIDILKSIDCKPNVESLLEHLPRLMPRPYSAASVQRESGEIDFVFNVVDFPLFGANDNKNREEMKEGEEKKGDNVRRGLCTGYLEDISKWEQLPKIDVYARSNHKFRHPSSLAPNLLMVGPGTGVAPFIGFLQQRRALIKTGKEEKIGFTWLFTGCRHRDKDQLFKEELQSFLEDNTLSELSLSFSRMDPKQYVQDAIKKDEEKFIKLLLDEDTRLFVCGDAKGMAKDVNETIIKCVARVKGVSEGEALRIVARLSSEGRYLQDVWT